MAASVARILSIFALASVAVLGANPRPTNFQHQYFQITAGPFDPSVALNQTSNKMCSVIYTINLRPEFTTQGNDIGMLQPHGKNTFNISGRWPNDTISWSDWPAGTQIGADYSNFPNPTDNQEQAYAQSIFSVKALIDPAGTPLGFKKDTMYMYSSVCVQVRGVRNRWVEIMAQTPQPDRKICVKDWQPEPPLAPGRPNLAQNPFQSSCGQGHIYSCRASSNEQVGPSAANPSGFSDNMNIRFYCDSCDDESFNFYWRVTASQYAPNTNNFGYVQPDGENFCLWRSGSDYPSSLLQPYPENYVPPPVFQLSTSSAMSVVVSAWVLVVLGLLSLLL